MSGRTWLVTGASAGLGRAMARAVVEAGDRIVATARDPGALADLVALAPDRVAAVRLDVAEPADIARAADEARRAFGHVDVLVNNAGYGFIGGVEESSDAEIRAQFEVNFFGAVAMTKALLPAMRERGSGWVVNISSIAGVRGRTGTGFYSASKFALEGFSEGLASEMAPFGVKVLVVEPGAFRTDFSGRSIAGPKAPMAVYSNTAETRAWSKGIDGVQPGDPDRAARVIMQVIDSPEPPFRVVLGKASHPAVLQLLQERMDDVKRGQAYAEAADFPEAGQVGSPPTAG